MKNLYREYIMYNISNNADVFRCSTDKCMEEIAKYHSADYKDASFVQKVVQDWHKIDIDELAEAHGYEILPFDDCWRDKYFVKKGYYDGLDGAYERYIRDGLSSGAEVVNCDAGDSAVRGDYADFLGKEYLYRLYEIMSEQERYCDLEALAEEYGYVYIEEDNVALDKDYYNETEEIGMDYRDIYKLWLVEEFKNTWYDFYHDATNNDVIEQIADFAGLLVTENFKEDMKIQEQECDLKALAKEHGFVHKPKDGVMILKDYYEELKRRKKNENK